MSDNSDRRSREFLSISDQFQLGVLTTEGSHPVTANLSEIAKQDIRAGLKLLFNADADVLRRFSEVARSGQLRQMKEAVSGSLKAGGRVFCTGCGSTGRLSIQLVSIWRDFWQKQQAEGFSSTPSALEMESRFLSVMAGGDFALIKSVEGFEDYAAFGEKQIEDHGVRAGDVVFAITEGGETSFVIGTAWKGAQVGAKVFFVYNNPDEVLCAHVRRSREVLQEPRIEKINLTTGPMSITGSTRMQATSIQLAVLLTVMEMVLRDWIAGLDRPGDRLPSEVVPERMLEQLQGMHATLTSPEALAGLSSLVNLEETVYRHGGKNNYFADAFGIDLLTDTTERSPTYCTPSFRKSGETGASASWAFLFINRPTTPEAWKHILKREPKCVEWSKDVVLDLVGEEKAVRTHEIISKISREELLRFQIGLDGLDDRKLGVGDSAIALVWETEKLLLLSPGGFYRRQLEDALKTGASAGVLFIGTTSAITEVKEFLKLWDARVHLLCVPVPESDLLLAGVARVGLKLILNALSTCTMVRLGRVLGNYMIWVVPSNLKLIDRSTRYIQKLSGLDYRSANNLLFEVIEYIEPRMKADQAYPPAVALAVLRARHNLGNEAAERLFSAGRLT